MTTKSTREHTLRKRVLAGLAIAGGVAGVSTIAFSFAWPDPVRPPKVVAAIVGLFWLFLALLYYAGRGEIRRAAPGTLAEYETVAVAEALPTEERSVMLECAACSTRFRVADSGERPLYHACIGCGTVAVLPVPEFKALPAGSRRLFRVRCRCLQVFQLEDSGERPLRHRCPHCGRLGEVGGANSTRSVKPASRASEA